MMLIARGPPKRVENPFRFGLFFLQFFLIFLFIFFKSKFVRKILEADQSGEDAQP